MPIRSILITAFSALTLTAGVSLADAQPRLGHNLSLGGGEYTTGGGLTVAMEPRRIGGNLGLCGAWAQSDRLAIHARNAGRQVLSKGSVALEGRVLTHNFNFLKQVRAADNYAGKPAGCVRLSAPWHPRYDHVQLDIRIPRQKIHTSDASRRQGGANRVFFTRSHNANPALTSGSLLPSKITRPWSSYPLE